MLNKDPRQRISLSEALQHDFFKIDIKDEDHHLDSEKRNQLIKNLKAYKMTNSFNKAVRICMSKLYENSNVEKLKKLFLKADSNNNGKLDRNEFQEVMIQLDFTGDEIDLIWNALDTSGDGEIEYSEFLAGCTNLDQANLYIACSIIFSMMDKDNSKTIDFREFRNF